MPLQAGLLGIVVCPACHSALREEDEELVCSNAAECGLAYPIRDGVPALLVDEARRPA